MIFLIPDMALVDEHSPSTQVPYDLRDTLGCFAARTTNPYVVKPSYKISFILWGKALRYYLQLNIFYMYITIHSGIGYLPVFFQTASEANPSGLFRNTDPSIGRVLGSNLREIYISYWHRPNIWYHPYR